MVGGFAGLVGAAVIGPRTGRFEGSLFKVKVNDMPAGNTTFVTLGVFILWTGWYGFNTGSTLAIVGAEQQAEIVVMNTTIAPAAAAATCLFFPALLQKLFKKETTFELEPMLNGCLGGLVSITAGCAVCDPAGSFIIGVIGGLIYLGSSKLLKQLKIDDVLDASPVHFFCGAWGVIAVGLFATEKNAAIAGLEHYGSFYGDDGSLLEWQLAEVFMIILWVGGFSLLIFVPLKLMGLARVSLEDELKGLDDAHHGGRDQHKSVPLEGI